MKRACILLLLIVFLANCKKSKSSLDNTSCDHGLLILGDSTSYIMLPTAITPNGDGKNDYFRPQTVHFNPSSFSLSIETQDGTPIFQTNRPDGYWDGTVYGALGTDYKYIVKLQYTANNKTVDTCTYLFSVLTKNGCIPANADMDKYIFEDQWDPYSAKPLYPTSETFCQ